ncbi:hypothetical protein Ciccas_003869 [Cichlidogyrus casuarinus]|uniref:DNA-directed DNA polymerase family A palm domain-containing protein n=1 Tax=Cichlidogyrus casuarinus TaxID=1844966 RepID=A0ABD2QD50_9PLAT
MNVEVLQECGQRFEKALAILTSVAHDLNSGSFNLDVPAEVSRVLYCRLHLAPMSSSAFSNKMQRALKDSTSGKLTGLQTLKMHMQLASVDSTKRSPSTSADNLRALAHKHPMPSIILQFRQLNYFKQQSFSSLFLKTHLPCEPWIITPREAFQCRSGATLVSADFKQLELRILAHLSNDQALQTLLQNQDTTEDAFRVVSPNKHWLKRGKEEEVTEEERNRTKKLVYAIIYGMTTEGLAADMETSLEKARSMQREARVLESAQKHGYVRTIMGRVRRLEAFDLALEAAKAPPGTRISPKPADLARAERQSLNSIVQGSAADIAKMAMLLTSRSIAEKPSVIVKLVLHLHDELIYEVFPKNEAMAFARRLSQQMSATASFLKMKVPLPVKVKTGPTWARLETCDS